MAKKKAPTGTSGPGGPPKKQTKPQRTPICLPLENNLLERLDALASKRGYTWTALIKLAIHNLLKSGAHMDGETPDDQP